MMVLSAARPDASLREFLVQRARAATLVRLAADLAAGVAGASVTIFWWRPESRLLVLSVALAFVAYGGWGIADRFRAPSAQKNGGVERVLAAICALLAIGGILAGTGIIYGVWSIALGTWIS
jgi:hypothetical protein